MSYFGGSYRQLLFGVSQQIPKDRLDGQVDEQINMTSDLVTGPRRRGAVRAVAETISIMDPTRVARAQVILNGQEVLVLVDTQTGDLSVINDQTGAVLYTANNSYLVATVGRSLRFATIDDSVFIANVEVLPQSELAAVASGYPDNTKAGYIYAVAGAFSKTYNLSVTNRDTGVTTTVSMTTSASDPAQASPEYIITQLTSAASANATIGTAAGVAYYQTGAYLYIAAPFKMTVSTDSGSTYIRASNAASIADSSELPARLAPQADGFIVAAGRSTTKTYFRWIDLEKRWVEDAAREAQEVLVDMPIRLRYDTAYVLEAPEYERRTAGDADSNPTFKLLERGITGLTTMQGRLVILAGEYVCMSASNKPLRWFRTSVASLLDDDPIEVAATAQTSSPYEYAVQFNKDLVMFSKTHQGIVPGSAGLTPRTATAAVMTTYSFQNACSPVVTGRTVFFAAPRADGFAALWEMLPSQFTDSQVEADDATPHIPRYVAGPVRFLEASTTTNVLVAGTSDPRELLVHEWRWSAGEKVHTSWHKWTFRHDVLSAYFTGDRLVLLFNVAGTVVLGDINLRAGAGEQGYVVGRLDFGQEITVTEAGKVSIPDWVYALHTPGEVFLYKLAGDFPYLGQLITSVALIGSDYIADVEDAQIGDRYLVGSKFLSKLAPTRPVLKDQNGVPITTERTLLHRLVFSMTNVGEVTFRVSDIARSEREYVTTPLRLFSRSLDAGMPLSDSATVPVPCRVDMQTAQFSVETTDFYDLNITSLEYGYRYNQRYRR